MIRKSVSKTFLLFVHCTFCDVKRLIVDLFLWPQIMRLEEELQRCQQRETELKNELSSLLNQPEPIEIAKGLDVSSNKELTFEEYLCARFVAC